MGRRPKKAIGRTGIHSKARKVSEAERRSVRPSYAELEKDAAKLRLRLKETRQRQRATRKELTQAREQQTATSEVLKIISRF